MSIPSIILAAGASRRMGRPKLSLPWGGGLVVSAVLRAAGRGALVVVRPGVEAELLGEVERCGGVAVAAERAAEGQAESLKAGIRAVLERFPDAPGVLVFLGDQPTMRVETADMVRAAFAETPHMAVAAACGGLRGHPVALPRRAFEAVLQLRGDEGAREVLHQVGLRLVETSDRAVCEDVDTPEAYVSLKKSGEEIIYSRDLAWLKPICWLPAADGDAPDLAPDEATCLAILERHGIFSHILDHCRRVADFAVAMAQRALDVRGVRTPDWTFGVPADIVEDTLAAGLLHDVAKSWCIVNGGSHAQLGANWVVAETGNFRVAQAVMHHVEWPWELPPDVCAPAHFVSYADRRVMHDGYVTVKERYRDLLVRYGHTEAQRASINRSHEQAIKLERALSAQLELPLYACTLAGGRLVAGA